VTDCESASTNRFFISTSCAQYSAGIHLHRQCLHRLRVSYSYAEGDLRLETAAWIWRYVAWALGAGLGSGLLGIGGGMILGPLLLDLGVNPRVSAPVTHYMARDKRRGRSDPKL